MKKSAPAPVLSEKTAEIIRHKIITGELAPGTRLSEAALSERLAISRNTLREVFRLLTQEGLLHYEPNCGVCVALPDMAAIIDIYRIRRLIECDALRQAWPLHPAVERMAQQITLAREHARRGDWGAVGTANMLFHTAIVELSDSPRLVRLYRHISAELRLAFGHLDDLEMLHAPYIDKNDALLALLNSGKNEQAAQMLAGYLEQSERTLLAVLQQRAAQ